MRRISHTVYCSSAYHEVWRDTEGRLHRTCNGEGCTLGFEKARALLAGKPEIDPGRAHFRARYRAKGWGEDWQDAKRRGWQTRARRRRARGELVVTPLPPIEASFWSDDDDERKPKQITAKVKNRILADVYQAIRADLLQTTYRRPRSTWLNEDITLHADIVWNQNTPQIICAHPGRKDKTTKTAKKVLHAVECNMALVTSVAGALRLRASLGGSNLFRTDTGVFMAAGVLERRLEGVVVAAGQQRPRGLGIDCVPALVTRDSSGAKLVRWMTWQELSDSTVELYSAHLGYGGNFADGACMAATRGRPQYAELRANQASFVAQVAVRSTTDVVANKAALDRLPPADELQRLCRESIRAAREYADKWGELVGCPKSCLLFTVDEESLLSSRPSWLSCPKHSTDVVTHLFSLHNTESCDVGKEFLDLTGKINMRHTLESALKQHTRQMKATTATLRRFGFRLTDSQELEELPL